MLGNHDNGKIRDKWLAAFKHSSIALMENRWTETRVGDAQVCVVGHGDFYTNEWAPVALPARCDGRTIRLTHDPYGLIADNSEVRDLGFAGHTHCGQFAFPFGIVLYVPTQAPDDMHCGRFDRGAGGVVTGGLGYTKLDLRFGPGTELSWDLVLVNQSNQ